MTIESILSFQTNCVRVRIAISQIGANPRDGIIIANQIDPIGCAEACGGMYTWYGQEYRRQQTCREQSEL